VTQYKDAPVFKIVAVLALLTLLLAASCVTVTPAHSQEGTPYPTLYCFFDPQGNWVCFSGTNDLTPTPTVIVVGEEPEDPFATPPILTPFVPTATPTPAPTPTATVVIQPADVCVVFYCQFLPIGRG